MKTTEESILVEHFFKQSIEHVWKAITDLDDMTQWFFDNIPAFEPKVGFKTQFTVTSEDREFCHLWEITEVIHLKKIVYHWNYEAYEGDSFVSFDLSKQGQQTKLKLTTTVVKDFPDDISEFKRERCLEGWNYLIKERLAKYLQKT